MWGGGVDVKKNGNDDEFVVVPTVKRFAHFLGLHANGAVTDEDLRLVLDLLHTDGSSAQRCLN